ncbi:vitamin K-dependent protein C-like [Neodiprion virginianus]|uniref:vitamin K-dependent protein C-like n=1 Tax=Neodiprion virginianus TaxID=2961670 RepID=UPI001EE6DCFC|nr:vitamin K-dependent protein C-like [Neodiprion virginianus]
MALRIVFSVTLFMTVMVVKFVLSAENDLDISSAIDGSNFDGQKTGSNWFQAAIFRSTLGANILSCGGTLLTDRWIVTGASCLWRSRIEDLTIRLGEFDLENEEEPLKAEEYKVEKIEINPEYEEIEFRNDIALLKLDRIVKFDKHIIPVCLPSEDLSLVNRTATVTGWGFINEDSRNFRTTVLRQVDVEVFSNERCNEWFSEVGLNRLISESELCAGRVEGGKDACTGDSGGPLTTLINGRKILIGIVTWGKGCGRRHSPGVYAKINHFVPWIKNVMKN